MKTVILILFFVAFAMTLEDPCERVCGINWTACPVGCCPLPTAICCTDSQSLHLLNFSLDDTQ